METKMASVYNPAQVENKWYEEWKEKGYFKADPNPDKPAFSIVMPPPNVTGQLHLGHALDNTIQDILSRWRRMQGYSVLWLPGTDHAGIATQAKVEEALRKEGTNRHELGREKFLERVWDWKHQYGSKITKQLSLMGSSCDWSRERFTMDEGCSRAVREVFVNLYNKGLIYQGNYMVNWCPKCQTAISDIEVEHEDSASHLWHLRYPIEGTDQYVIVATTRPETMLGDTGVAVHPEDERYTDLVGKNVILPLVGRKIPIFADSYVEKEFGTGAVKVTPAHDPNDFDMALRNHLEQIQVIDTKGIMNENAGAYAGMDRDECRKQIVKDLDAQGYLVKTEDFTHSVGHCQRCHTIIEPMVSKQWFVKMQPLAEPAIERVKNGETRFVPERFTKIYLSWMENIRDWCISRQLWWGHRIPVWYCQDCGEVICVKEDPTSCPHCGGNHLKQDEDVLDTWFSSALWPFSTMGWPDDTEDLKRYYPTTALVTGRDIIFFWVARMIFSAIEHTGQTPFKDVNIHGLILDEQGRKMSKSLGNGIDPIEVIEKFGADTLRLTMITGVTPGNDIRFHWKKVENTRNFANKLWNASRFVTMNLEDYEPMQFKAEDLSLADRWILSRMQERIADVTRMLEEYDLGDAARSLYEFIWDEFCDWYIELAKGSLFQKEDARRRRVVQTVLLKVLTNILKMMHPFMPFITEEIYHNLPVHEETIMLTAWPTVEEEWKDEQAAADMQEIMNAIKAIRNIRAEFNVNPGQKIQAMLEAEPEKKTLAETGLDAIKTMAAVGTMSVTDALAEKPRHAISALTGLGAIYVPLEGLIDLEKEKARINKELKKVEADLQQAEGKLNNEKFTAKAPAEVIEKEKMKAAEAQTRKEGLLQRLQMIEA